MLAHSRVLCARTQGKTRSRSVVVRMLLLEWNDLDWKRKLLVILMMMTDDFVFLMMPFFSRSSNVSSTSFSKATGTSVGVCCTGFTVSSVTNVELPMWPSPSKTSLNVFKMVSLERGSLGVLSTTWTSSGMFRLNCSRPSISHDSANKRGLVWAIYHLKR